MGPGRPQVVFITLDRVLICSFGSFTEASFVGEYAITITGKIENRTFGCDDSPSRSARQVKGRAHDECVGSCLFGWDYTALLCLHFPSLKTLGQHLKQM